LIISSFILHRPVFFITQQCSKLFKAHPINLGD